MSTFFLRGNWLRHDRLATETNHRKALASLIRRSSDSTKNARAKTVPSFRLTFVETKARGIPFDTSDSYMSLMPTPPVACASLHKASFLVSTTKAWSFVPENSFAEREILSSPSVTMTSSGL